MLENAWEHDFTTHTTLSYHLTNPNPWFPFKVVNVVLAKKKSTCLPIGFFKLLLMRDTSFFFLALFYFFILKKSSQISYFYHFWWTTFSSYITMTVEYNLVNLWCQEQCRVYRLPLFLTDWVVPWYTGEVQSAPKIAKFNKKKIFFFFLAQITHKYENNLVWDQPLDH